MIIVADAGPLLHLFWVDALAWALPASRIIVVEAVWREVSRHAPEALQDSRLQRVTVSSPVAPSLRNQRLDSGEEASLAYALAQPEKADVLFLCDEMRARRACRDLSLAVKGSVGLILDSVDDGRVSAETARTALRDLPGRGRLYASPDLIAHALAALDAEGEMP